MEIGEALIIPTSYFCNTSEEKIINLEVLLVVITTRLDGCLFALPGGLHLRALYSYTDKMNFRKSNVILATVVPRTFMVFEIVNEMDGENH